MGRCGFVRVAVLFVLLILVLATSVGAQGLQQSPYSAPNVVRGGPPGGGLDLAPSNPLGLPGSTMGLPGGSESLYVSDGMLRGILPLTPNLQFGYLYDFGNNRVSTGRFTADYLLPVSVSPNSELFGEAHTEFDDFWKTLKSVFTHGTTYSAFNNRVDMSFGGGFRTFLRRDKLLGVNGFYDTSRLAGTWYSSGGLGFEMAALMGSDALDFNFNWYGQLFNSNVLINAFKYGPSNFDFQAGYSHELWNGGPDLRLSATGYKFDIGNSVYGWNGGAELWSRDAMFVLRYNVGHDKINKTYQEVGGFVNIGFQLGNIFRGESPFTKPEPIFKSPRTLRYMLTQPVRRDWHQPATVVAMRHSPGQSSSPRKPFFLFELWDKTTVAPAGAFDQQQQVPLTALTWSVSHIGYFANATSYAVIVVDPDKTLPSTISVTLTPSKSASFNIIVDPNSSILPYTIPAALTDGTPNIVVHNNPLNGVPQAGGSVASGTITITDTTPGTTVTPLVVTVTENP
ncbi:MAG: hypothetical protein WBG50_18850 [Desulfomonilaceae bacterium]